MLWWMSFSEGGHKCLGCCVVEADDPLSACTKAWELECNPGGSVVICRIPKPYEEMCRPHIGKLFTDFEEIQRIFGPCSKGSLDEIAAQWEAKRAVNQSIN